MHTISPAAGGAGENEAKPAVDSFAAWDKDGTLPGSLERWNMSEAVSTGSGLINWSYDQDMQTFRVWDDHVLLRISREVVDEMNQLFYRSKSNTPPTDELLNQFRIGETAFEAMYDRVTVLVDPFRSGYECPRCEGQQKTPCTDCEDGRSRMNPNIQCKTCAGTKQMTCPDCNGTGVEHGGLVVPDDAQNKPQMGTIVSVGEWVGMGVQRLFGSIPLQTHDKSPKAPQVGDRVLFGRFSGHDLKLDTSDGRSVELRILNESEILQRVHGNSLTLRRVGKGNKEEVL
jgi:chaperonin GroES